MEYPLPLYLNQKYVFDILAMMEGGLAQVESIRTTQASEAQRERAAGGEIGASNVFALIGVKLSADRKRKDSLQQGQEVTAERVHTPNSLFARMRERLHEEECVKELSETPLKPGDFVEFQVVLKPNPLIHALEALKSVGGMLESLVATQGKEPQSELVDFKRTMKMIETFLAHAKAGGTVDLIGTDSTSGLNVVITLDRSYLPDPNLQDLIDGEFTVLGKVGKVLPRGEKEGLNLLRKSGLSHVSETMLTTLTTGFSQMKQAGINLPDVVTEVPSPAVQIIAVAIFA